MFSDDQEDTTIYDVVVNHEEQYSIWPADREKPLGWKSGGKTGTKQECLDYINEVWTDMRPLSLRRHMENVERRRAESPNEEEVVDDQAWNRGPTLVERLCEGRHPIEANMRPERTVQILKECIDRGYVHIKFTQTRGGTELGVRLDNQACRFQEADFDNKRGTLHLEGGLTLDYVKVRCIADIDLSTLAGEGHLSLV